MIYYLESLDVLANFVFLFFSIGPHHYLGWYGTTVCTRPGTAYPLYTQTFDEECDLDGDGGDGDGDDGDGDNFDLLRLVPWVDGEVSHHTCDLWQSTGSHWNNLAILTGCF